MSSPNLVERMVASIEAMRISLKEYELLDDGTQKAVRHQLYTRTGGFAKAIFKDTEPPFRQLYTDLEQKLGMAPFMPSTVVIHTKGGKITDVNDLPPWMDHKIVDHDTPEPERTEHQ